LKIFINGHFFINFECKINNLENIYLLLFQTRKTRKINHFWVD